MPGGGIEGEIKQTYELETADGDTVPDTNTQPQPLSSASPRADAASSSPDRGSTREGERQTSPDRTRRARASGNREEDPRVQAARLRRQQRAARRRAQRQLARRQT